MARRVASREKKSPSMPKAIPKAAPKRSIKRGQSSPNSKLSTVPVTAPTAKVTAIAFDQRHAETGEDDVEAEREGHLLAGGEQIGRRRGQGKRVGEGHGRTLFPAAGA